MNAANTPGIGIAIDSTSLDFVPEAHCFIRWKGEAIDCTNPDSNLRKIEHDILLERYIVPEQVGQWKANFHKNYIQQWLNEHPEITYSLNEVWEIRENCILALSTDNK